MFWLIFDHQSPLSIPSKIMGEAQKSSWRIYSDASPYWKVSARRSQRLLGDSGYQWISWDGPAAAWKEGISDVGAILVIFCPWFFGSKFHFKVGRCVELVGENGAFQPYVRRFICGNGRTCNSTSNMYVAIASGDQSGDSAYISSSNSMWPAQKFTMSS